MDILRQICSAIPDGMTGRSISNSILFAFGEAIEKDLISADFTQSEIDMLRPSLVGCPGCGTIPATEFIITISDLVNELEPIQTIGFIDSTMNMAGEEYSKLVRNLVALPTGFTAGARKVGKSVDDIRDCVKNMYPRYYRTRMDSDGVVRKVSIDEDGKKRSSTVNLYLLRCQSFSLDN